MSQIPQRQTEAWARHNGEATQANHCAWIDSGSLAGECLGVGGKELLQGQCVLSGHDADGICNVVPLLAIGDSRSEVLPQVREMIEGMRIEPVLNRIGPLFICDLDISDWSAEDSAKRLADLVHGWSRANQFIRPSRRLAGIGKKRGATRATSSAPTCAQSKMRSASLCCKLRKLGASAVP